MSYLKNLKDQEFDNLIVLEWYDTDRIGSRWKCKCKCGRITIVRRQALIQNRTKSCGCKQGNYVHNGYYLPEYSIWVTMHARCTNKNNLAFPDYGGRGIKVCERWYLFEN